MQKLIDFFFNHPMPSLYKLLPGILQQKRKVKPKVRNEPPKESRDYKAYWQLSLTNNYSQLKRHFAFILKGKII